jgi:aminoglycoside phosphotransferase (APT) family kinase protein
VEERRRIVTSEYRLLTLSAALGLRAPRPYFQDLDALAVGLEYIEGAPDFAPKNMADMLDQMAMELARIHRVPATAELEFLPRANAAFERELANAPERLDTTLGEERLRAVLRELWPWNGNPDVLLHGDYWPGNLLWNDGRLAAVLDWEEARIGDPLFDIAISRLDLVWAFGDDAMVEFTERYRTHATIDWENLARWDLAVALRPMSNLPRWVTSYAAPPIRRPDVTLETMRDGHRRFVERALRSLGLHRA